MTHDLTYPAVDNEALDELTAMLPGQVLVPGDPGWEEHSRGWILSVDQRPRAVLTVGETEDVVAAARWAARHGVAISAQPVGHGATTALDDTVLLRTRALREITIDTEQRIARVGAGVKWGELLAVTSELGLTGLVGSSPDPSVVGFCLGGGLSWFGRAYGLAAHSVVAVELVDAAGELRRVTASSDPELFWALCGGGGDFGIVTAMELRLHPAPHVFGGRLLWPIEMARPVLKAFRAVSATAPDALTLWAQLFRFPALDEIPEPLRGGAFVSIDVSYLGSAEEALALLEPCLELPARWLNTLGTVPLAELGSIAAEPVDPMPVSETSGLLRDFDDVAIDRLLAVVGAGSTAPLAVVQVRHLGGALARASAAEGPAGAVLEPYQFFCLGVPVAPEVEAAIQECFAEVRTALGGHTTGRTMFTFLGADDDPGRAFSPGALARLREVKRRTDPDGVFRSNRPVLSRG
ncbi:FAD/FMN-containing dehydrogenase [Kribbella antiqua]|uniref:FAD/FMN-containing dehydrogenase n=1 Tax=Kribbella antiqua TaxID=2512217 RepID=A0A4R2ICF9_9ACTN|nr:FAD-binding oxidoreductase [Kribbella antiqua]TCO42234.1 FAD/FMN-containing dehydrogenase [Kribbella antiqua]